jgi:hypothetical protein
MPRLVWLEAAICLVVELFMPIPQSFRFDKSDGDRTAISFLCAMYLIATFNPTRRTYGIEGIRKHKLYRQSQFWYALCSTSGAGASWVEKVAHLYGGNAPVSERDDA